MDFKKGRGKKGKSFASNIISGSQNALLQTTLVTLISVHKLASCNSLQLSNRKNKISLLMLALKEKKYILEQETNVPYQN